MKVHGSAKAKAMMNAIRVSGDAVAHQINQSIREEIAAANARIESAKAQAA
jgi:fatty acid/phospholipid biosynthesis enzyme